MIKITYDEYDLVLEEFERIRETRKMPVYWPPPERVESFYEDPERYVWYACYLHDMNPGPKTPAERYSKQNLMNFINDVLDFNDEEEDGPEGPEEAGTQAC